VETKNCFKALKKDENNIITYSYLDENGKCNISFNIVEENVEVKREGIIKSFLKVDSQKNTDFFYDNGFFKKKFNIVSSEIMFSKEIFLFKYIVLDDDTVINEIKITVKEGM